MAKEKAPKVKRVPAAGRPAKTPAAKVPPRTSGALNGSVRDRAKVDDPWSPAGKAAAAPKKAPAPKKRARKK